MEKTFVGVPFTRPRACFEAAGNGDESVTSKSKLWTSELVTAAAIATVIVRYRGLVRLKMFRLLGQSISKAVRNPTRQNS